MPAIARGEGSGLAGSTVIGVASTAVQALLDRGAELAELSRRLDGARAGAGRVIVVEGPAGIGKSALLAAAAERDGVLVLRARAHPLEQDAAWAVARQLFERLRLGPGWAALTSGAAALAERALAPEIAEPANGGEAMHAAVRGLMWLASNLGERSPAVLVVDDAHWADAATLRWLAVLAGSLHELPLAVLCAVRSGEPAAAPDLLAEVLAAAPEPPVRPRPLGADATAALVRSRLPDADDVFARACHDVTAGNPFLLVTLLAQLAADGVAPTGESAVRLGAFGPEQVARSVERQLARLPCGAGGLARAVAVLGPGTPLRRAAALARLGLDEGADAADALRAAGLLDAGQKLSLAHPLIAAALYSGIPPGQRSVRHAEAARLLARDDAGPEVVGLHLLHTEPAADPTTVTALREAASRASLRGAPQAAAAFLRRALAEPPAGGAVADVQLELGLALVAYLQPDAYDLLAAAVTAAAPGLPRAEAALRGARALGLSGWFERAVALCRQGLEQTSDVPDDLRARLEAELVTAGWLQRSTITASRDLAGSPRSRAMGLWRVNAAMAAVLAGAPARETADLLGPVVADGVLTREAESLLGSVAGFSLIFSDEFGLAHEIHEPLIQAAQPRGWLIALAHGCMMRALARTRRGEVRDAEADARLAFEYKLPVAPPGALLWSLTFLVDAQVELDELDQADAVLTAVGQLGEPPPGTLAAPLLLQSRARLRLAQHRPRAAYADACAARDRSDELLLEDSVMAGWRVEAVHALVALGDVAAARPLAIEQLRRAERVGTASACGAALRALAASSTDPSERLHHLERAVDVLAESAALLEQTRVLVDLGAALRRANRRADARVPLHVALDQAERGGMRLLARRARDELRAAGARPRRSAVSGPGALTPAEDRVARLAALGYTNRTIAERLYVTERTVETHLTHAFTKLNISTRTALAGALGGPAR
ncbi:MAG: ATP-binding protein [Kineosporiaceae bacterium]